MPAIPFVRLVSDHTNLELKYEESVPKERSRMGIFSDYAITLLLSIPITAFSTLAAVVSAINYGKSKWHQYKLVKVLTNQKQFEKYANERLSVCEKRIEKVKRIAKFRMESLKEPSASGLAIPQKKTLSERLSPNLPEERWKDFPWNEFLKVDFFQKSKIPDEPDNANFADLEECRIKLYRFERQKMLLSTLQGNQRVEMIRQIAELNLVKATFAIQQAKECFKLSLLFSLPAGIVWAKNYTNDRLIYEGKNSLLPAKTSLDKYKDLVDAHNQLIRNHDFLVPYLKSMK